MRNRTVDVCAKGAALILAVALGVSCTGAHTPSAAPNPVGPRMLIVEGVAVTFSGGNGESLESAILVHAPNEDVGVAAEYDYLSAMYGKPHEDWDRPLNEFVEQGDRQSDHLEVIDLSENSRHSFYFDITEFYGKIGTSAGRDHRVQHGQGNRLGGRGGV